MGLFSSASPFDADVEKVTDERNTSEDWGQIMDLCDRIRNTSGGSKDSLKSILKRLNSSDPRVVLQSITVLDACVNNCGKPFMLEVASREFETEFKKILGKSIPKIQEKLRSTLKKWAKEDFKNDSQLSLIPSLYSALKREGVDFSGSENVKKHQQTVFSKDPNVVSNQQEEDDIAKAIQLSLSEENNNNINNSQKKKSCSLYPTNLSDFPPEEKKRARALYDFEAAEDNELTFKAGEIVIISDDSDSNWWKGSNHRGEGLFPANFVSLDLRLETPVQSEPLSSPELSSLSPSPIVTINEEQMDKVLQLLHDSDPTSSATDSLEMKALEESVDRMGPLINAELEVVDRQHASLSKLSVELVDALNMYHSLMREAPVLNPPYGYNIGPSYGPSFPGAYPGNNEYSNMFSSSAPPPTPPLDLSQYPSYMYAGESYSGSSSLHHPPNS